MKLTVFQSEKGDCLLLTSSDHKHILVDGGMRASFRTFVAPALGKLVAPTKVIDLAYVSHIDQDHIAGVLQLMDDAVEWKVHEFQRKNGNPTHPKPRVPRPPEVRQIWHNAFHELLKENAAPVQDLLAATAAILSGSDQEELRETASLQQELATSIPEAIRLSRRVSTAQLGVPLNQPFGGKLAFVRQDQPIPDPIAIGSLNISLIGPFDTDLTHLKKNWNEWLATHQAALIKIRRQAERDAERLGTTDLSTLLDLQLAQAKELGDREQVTPPNLASLMLYVEEIGGATVLLTGDGHGSDIIKGLRFIRKLDDQGRIHVNVLKVQHHGSEHNMDEDFVAKVTADHYIFCGNGEHENPDLGIVQLLFDSRIGTAPSRTLNPKADGPFTFWFNSSEPATKRPPAKKHMNQLVELVTRLANRSEGRFSFSFLQDSTPFFEISL